MTQNRFSSLEVPSIKIHFTRVSCFVPLNYFQYTYFYCSIRMLPVSCGNTLVHVEHQQPLKTADLQTQQYTYTETDGEPLAQVCSPSLISKHIHNACQLWANHTGLALSCFISNGGLPGDSTCHPPKPPVPPTSAIWAAQPYSISRA